MFQTKWFRMVMVMAVLASLIVAPLVVSAQDATNGIIAPEDGATVSGSVEIMGYASDPNFKKWDLFVFPGGNEQGKFWVASGETAGEFTVPLDTTLYPDGEHALSLRVVKNDSNYDEYTSKFTIANAAAPAPAETPAVEATAAVTETETTPAAAPVAAPAPTNGFTNVEDGATVNGTVTVEGYADIPGFAKWQLDVLPGGSSDAAIFVALGETAGEFSYDLDTTAFPDGDHALRLRVVKSDGNYDEYTTAVTVANAGAPAEAPAATAAVTTTETTTPTVAPAPVATPAPVAKPAGEPGITSPEDGATVSGVVKVTGLTPTEGFERWELLIFPNGNDSALSKIYVTGGDSLGEIAYDLDTTKLPDGEHVIALRVVKPDTNYVDYRVAVVVANAPAAPAQ
jgi:hypothetical protein